MAGGDIRDAYCGKWYSLEKARDVERTLTKEAGTGDNWHWQDRSGQRITFSF